MRVRWLGWAGAEVESDGVSLVIDPLEDPAAVFAALGDATAGGRLPTVVAAEVRRHALAGLLSHLHRDHADAGALTKALADGAPVCHPRAASGDEVENLALAQADHELTAAGLARRELAEWQQIETGPFRLTALPAVDGLGDPQLSWLVEANGRRILHLGDTVFHGYWWRMAQRHGPFDLVFTPINGAVVRFPHRRPASPLPAALDPEQAALAGELLGARIVVPMHYDGFEIDPWYEPVLDAKDLFLRAAADRPYESRVLEPGDPVEL
jgi:L-ascorbate metabolism protein UlaG (beta-lactamase superfamily)